jgi:putative DNA primase/helicase
MSADRPGRAREIAVYDYRDETGAIALPGRRFENPKTFRQRRVLPKTARCRGDSRDLASCSIVCPICSPPIQRLTVFVVEGEKDADRLAALGLVATTSAMGAGKWRDEYAEALKGRHVVVIPDNDRPGREHADDIVKSLLGTAASVRLMPLEVPEKGDVSDWLDAGHTGRRTGGQGRRSSRWADRAPSTPSARSRS